MLAHAGVDGADQVADHRVFGIRVCNLLQRGIGPVQLAVADKQLGELCPRGRVAGLQPGNRAKRAERGAAVVHLERHQANEKVTLHEVRLQAENLAAVLARLVDLSPGQRLETLLQE